MSTNRVTDPNIIRSKVSQAVSSLCVELGILEKDLAPYLMRRAHVASGAGATIVVAVGGVDAIPSVDSIITYGDLESTQVSTLLKIASHY